MVCWDRVQPWVSEITTSKLHEIRVGQNVDLSITEYNYPGRLPAQTLQLELSSSFFFSTEPFSVQKFVELVLSPPHYPIALFVDMAGHLDGALIGHAYIEL